MVKRLASALLAVALALPGAAVARAGGEQGTSVAHGVVVGDVTPRSAVLWAGGDHGGALHVELSGPHRAIKPVRVRAADDWTGQVRLRGLSPGTRYSYRVRLGRGGRPVRGSFETPPRGNKDAAVRLAFGGDVAGQNVCRDAVEGFPIMNTIRATRPDLFVGLGEQDHVARMIWDLSGKFDLQRFESGVKTLEGEAGRPCWPSCCNTWLSR